MAYAPATSYSKTLMTVQDKPYTEPRTASHTPHHDF